MTLRLHLCILLPLFSVAGMAAPAIGTATGTGKFTLDRANHRSNATLFEGNSFDSGSSELEFRLEGGTTIHLGAAARGEVYHDRIALKGGGGDVRPGSGYSIVALNLRVKPMQSDAVARVVVEGGQVRVGALRGDLEVSNDKGVLLAKIAQGDADAFTPQTGSDASKASGAAVAGAGAGAAAGGTAAAGASAGAATAAGVGAVAAGTAAAGVSTAVIVAGVAVVGAGTAAGLSVAATSGSGDTSLSPSAR